MAAIFSRTLEVMDWMTVDAILKASPRSLMWCRRAIQSRPTATALFGIPTASSVAWHY